MSNWEPGVIPLSANFQNNTQEPLDARSVVPDLQSLGQIGFPYPGLIVFDQNAKNTYLCIHVDENIAANALLNGNANPTYWKKINDDSLIDGGAF